MATCSPSELIEASQCFACLSKQQLQAVIAQLLCNINANGGVAPAVAFVADTIPSLGAPHASRHPIFAFNKLMDITTDPAITVNNNSNFLGLAFVQNVMEQTTNDSYIGSILEGDLQSATNLIIWNNTAVGQRWNFAYNSDSSSNPNMFLFSFKNNLMDSIACKSDLFTTANAARTNNWPVMFGVGHAGNCTVGVSNVGVVSFPLEFAGIDSRQTTNSTGTLSNFVGYVGASSFDGVNPGAGNGDYRILSRSPVLINQRQQWLLPQDITGQYRGGYDPPGAYSSANPRKGDFIGL